MKQTRSSRRKIRRIVPQVLLYQIWSPVSVVFVKFPDPDPDPSPLRTSSLSKHWNDGESVLSQPAELQSSRVEQDPQEVSLQSASSAEVGGAKARGPRRTKTRRGRERERRETDLMVET